MKVVFSEAAELELKEAVNYYNEQREGLGFEFANEVKQTIIAVMHLHRKPDYWKSRL